MIAFTWYSPQPALKHSQTIMFPPCLTDGIKYSSRIFSFVLHVTNVLLFNANKLDLSVHNTSSPIILCPMSVFFCWFKIFSFYWFVTYMAFSLNLFLEGQGPGVTSSLLKSGVLLFNKSASWGPVRHLFLKLETLETGDCFYPHTVLRKE